jgi:hypothetical protein
MPRLEDELAALWGRHRPGERAGSHPFPMGTAPAVEWEPENSAVKQQLTEPVPGIPTVPTEFDKGVEPGSAGCGLAGMVEWEERAAILEFDGGMSRREAELRAAAELGFQPKAAEPPSDRQREGRSLPLRGP